MARKTSPGRFAAYIELPWWASVIFAAIIYVFLNWIFPSLAGSHSFLEDFAAAARSFSWLLAALFLVLASVSLSLEYRRKRLLDLQTSLAAIRTLPWQRFEQFIAEAFHHQGYLVLARGGSATPVGSVDFVLTRGNEKVLVQCKRWRSDTIGVAPVRELYDAMTSERGTGCAFVTSGTFGDDALGFAAGKPIRLIDGQELERMLRGVKTAAGSSGRVHAPESPLS